MQYYYATGTNQIGPVDYAELKRVGISPQTLVWRQGLDQWVAAGSLPELSGLFVTSANFSQGSMPANPVGNPYYQPTKQGLAFASFGERTLAAMIDVFILAIPVLV